MAVDETSNEFPAVLTLPATPAPNGCIVTNDAMGYQRAIAPKLLAQGAEYAFASKEDQPALA